MAGDTHKKPPTKVTGPLPEKAFQTPLKLKVRVDESLENDIREQYDRSENIVVTSTFSISRSEFVFSYKLSCSMKCGICGKKC